MVLARTDLVADTDAEARRGYDRVAPSGHMVLTRHMHLVEDWAAGRAGSRRLGVDHSCGHCIVAEVVVRRNLRCRIAVVVDSLAVGSSDRSRLGQANRGLEAGRIGLGVRRSCPVEEHRTASRTAAAVRIDRNLTLWCFV